MSSIAARSALSLIGALALAAGSLAPALPRGPGSPTQAVIVQGAAAPAAAGAVEDAGGSVVRHLPLVDGVSAKLTAAAGDRLRRLGYAVSPDSTVRTASSSFEAPGAQLQIEAARPGEHWGVSAGEGVGVALIDTGVADVPELDGRLVRGPDLSGEGDGIDRYGHGTFMAGLIAGERTGLAPGAHVVSVKVAGANGETTLGKVIEAIGWVMANADEHDVRVLSLSLAVDSPMSWQADPLSVAVEAAWASGIVVVAAAGNAGAGEVASPGRDPWVLTTGASDPVGTAAIDDDVVPAWSAQGRHGQVVKPEIVAPGVGVVSLRAPGSLIDRSHPAARVGDRWFRGSGTSMAAALTAGAAATILWGHPEATPDDVKGAVVATADPVQGGSILDLGGALAAPAQYWDQELRVAGGDARQREELARMPWSGVRWSGVRWSGVRWSGVRWSGVRWSGVRWSGVRWSGVRWSGVRWSGVRWSGVRWSDTQWGKG